MTTLIATDTHNIGFTEDFFGGNILATRDRLGDEGTYDEAADTLNLSTIRYPGGSLTERYFDLSDPDKTEAPHYEVDDTVGLLPYSDFMAFAEATGREALIVLPTRTQLSEVTDAHGNRFADIDEDTLRGFIRDTLDGKYGDPVIRGFEIGNEYWDSGEMSSVEYGRVASEMARILDDEITNHPDFEEKFQDTDILVQMGMNYGYGNLEGHYEGTAEEQLAAFMEEHDLNLEGDFIYSNGNVAWPQLSNYLIMREFDEIEINAVDGIVAHVYSRGEDATGSQYFSLQTIDRTWGEEYPELRPVVTEWNVRNRGRESEEDFGLIQSHEMLDLLEAMSFYDTESANIYPIQQRSGSSLMGDEGKPMEQVSGVFFQMLEQNLPGTRPVVLEGAESRQTELELDHANVHSFVGDDRMVFYILSTEDSGSHSTQMDVSSLFTAFDTLTATRLGVAEGDNPGDTIATPTLTDVAPSDVYQNGILTADLAPREILQITVEGAVFAPEFEPIATEAPVEYADPDTLTLTPFETASDSQDQPAPAVSEPDIAEATAPTVQPTPVEPAPAPAPVPTLTPTAQPAEPTPSPEVSFGPEADTALLGATAGAGAGQTYFGPDGTASGVPTIEAIAADDDAADTAQTARTADQDDSDSGMGLEGLLGALGLLPLMFLMGGF